MREVFRKFANRISTWTGSASAFLLAFAVVVVWAVSGPAFHFSSTWQLFINTGTTIVTFLMVFLIQNTQNRDGKALQLKLDELIRASSAKDSFVDLEDLTDAELSELEEEFKHIHQLYTDASPPQSLHKLHRKIRAAHERRHKLQ
jgi:low affinity Fe/Cu permease